MIRQVIYQTEKMVWMIPVSKFNKFVYDNELKILKLMLCDCSNDFIERLKECSQEELVDCLMWELEESKETIYMN